MTSFSRLQLAAALIEYDNDPDDPNPQRSAQDSAIFSHIRTQDAPRARTLTGFEHLRETPNLLGVEIPRSETASARGSVEARRSLAGTRNSRGSIDVLRNPFGDDIPESERGMEEENEEEDPEVDLEAWGMADFLGNKEKNGSKNKRTGPRVRQLSKAQSEILPQSYSQASGVDELGRLEPRRYHQRGARSLSMGGFGSGNEFLEAIRGGAVASEADFRRRSIAAPLDPVGRKTPDFAFDRPMSATGLKQAFPNRVPLRNQSLNPTAQTIPFPTTSPDPQEEEERLNSFALPLSSATSRFDPKAGGVHTRAISSASVGSYPFLDSGRDRTLSTPPEDNPFVLPPPNSTSRFDPKALPDTRRMSRASLGGQSILEQRERVTSFASIGTQGLVDEDNPFSLPLPSPTRISRFDPKAAAHTRTISNASLGSRMPPDGDRMSIVGNKVLDQEPPQSRRYSRMDLMRPKVLIMPRPLQGAEGNFAPPQLPEGFQLTTIGPPLPPGAKSSGRAASHLMPPSISGLQPPVASDSFTPNPRISMSLSQLTFRNSLVTGGQRDVAYEDIEDGLRRAREDGEQIFQEEDIEEEIAEEKKQAQGKAPGKLYGRSLMDELEARKEKMKSKQRVFTGDQRPTMMLRGQIRRSSTLIDPATLQGRPVSQAFGDRPTISRRASSSSKPLLDFSGESPVNTGAANGKIGNSKSVFGVDQLWERELARLKEIEAAEKVEEEERRQKEEEKEAKKGKKKRKGKPAVPSRSLPDSEAVPRPSKVSELPPTLPAIAKATPRRSIPAVAPDSDSDTDSQVSEYEAKVKAARRGSQAEGWGSSDDEKRRKPNQYLDNSDSEDDVPLVLKLQMPSIRAVRPPSPDSEDEKPLAKVLEQKSMIPDFSFNTVSPNSGIRTQEDAEEDDMPLAVRHPRAHSMVAHSVNHGDDDDKPLGLKQAEQHQQAQLNIMAQQQMMMQAQLHNSMAFSAPSMLSGFSPFILPPPAFSPAPGPPIHDPAKYHSVDQWRHNVGTD